MQEPKLWNSWKGQIIRAIAIDDAHRWEEIQEITELSYYSMNRALAEMYKLAM